MMKGFRETIGCTQGQWCYRNFKKRPKRRSSKTYCFLDLLCCSWKPVHGCRMGCVYPRIPCGGRWFNRLSPADPTDDAQGPGCIRKRKNWGRRACEIDLCRNGRTCSWDKGGGGCARTNGGSSGSTVGWKLSTLNEQKEVTINSNVCFMFWKRKRNGLTPDGGWCVEHVLWI